MTSDRYSVLVVDDEAYLLPTFKGLLGNTYEVLTASSANEAEGILRAREVDILLTDQRMPQRSGIDLLRWAAENCPKTVRMLMTGYSELDETINAINQGQVYLYLTKPFRTPDLLQALRNAADKRRLERGRDELLEQLQALNLELEQRVVERTREVSEANRLLQQRQLELEQLALTDGLTGLYNRRAMDDLLRFELKRLSRYSGGLAVGYVDVDHFKDINTRYLHTGGDQVLQSLARTLTMCVREVDSVGRVGGEEFLILARETNLDGALVLAERIRAAVEATPVQYNGDTIHLTVSVGFAVAESPALEDAGPLMKLAAEALGYAKATGRNRTEVRLYQTVGAVASSAS